MSNEHEYDFDSDMIDIMYGMTNLDKEIAQKGGLPKMKKLTGNARWTPHTWRVDIISNDSRSIEFALHYRVKVDSWFASVSDTDDTFTHSFDIPDDSAYFMLDIEDYERAKDSHKEWVRRKKRK